MYFAIRGATTVSKDDKQEIISATEELISQIIARNGLNGENCRYVSLIARVMLTADIPNSEREIKHVYLRNAAKLRPDISAQ